MNSSLKAHRNSHLFPPEVLQLVALQLLVAQLEVLPLLLRKRSRWRRKKRRKSPMRIWALVSLTKCKV